MKSSHLLRAFIALYSVLVISGLLLLLVAGASTAALLAHEAVTDEYSYREAQQAAFSCIRFALERFDADPNRFNGIGTTTIKLTDSLYCGILAASTTGNEAAIFSFGSSTASYVTLRATALRISSTTQFQIRTWTQD